MTHDEAKLCEIIASQEYERGFWHGAFLVAIAVGITVVIGCAL